MSFLDNYAIYSSNNEVPPIFHKWTALSVLASAVSRRVWTDQGIFQVYPNLYVILVADPGWKKSTAKDLGALMTSQLPDIPQTAETMSKQELTKILGAIDSPCKQSFQFDSDGSGTLLKVEYAHLTVYCDEFIDFLEVGQPGPMINFLTACYNGYHGGVSTKGRGRDAIGNIFLNLLACMTRDTNMQLTKQKIITTGFQRRCLFVYTNELPPACPRLTITPEMMQANDDCVEWLREVQRLKGPFVWTKEGDRLYDSWYRKNHNGIPALETDAERFFANTKPNLVLKLAMLLQISEELELKLTAPHITQAIVMLDEVERNIRKMFAGTGKNESAELAEKILEYLQNNRRAIPVKKLHAMFWRDAKGKQAELDEITEHLVRSEKVNKFPQTIGEGARQQQVDYVQIKSVNGQTPVED